MNDRAIVTIVLNEAAMIIADHFESERDPLATVKRLIEVLADQDLAVAMRRIEKGDGLRVVK